MSVFIDGFSRPQVHPSVRGSDQTIVWVPKMGPSDSQGSTDVSLKVVHLAFLV